MCLSLVSVAASVWLIHILSFYPLSRFELHIWLRFCYNVLHKNHFVVALHVYHLRFYNFLVFIVLSPMGLQQAELKSTSITSRKVLSKSHAQRACCC